MMDVAAWTAIVGPITTLLSGVGGYWLAGRNDEAKDQRAAAREASARRAALAERLEEDRHTFQRDTLLELQDELQRLARITTRILLQDETTLKEQGQLSQLPPRLSDEKFEILTSVRRLQVRVLDPELRRAVGHFVSTCSRASLTVPGKDKDRDELLAEVRSKETQVAGQYEALNEMCGERARRELDRRSLAAEPFQASAP